MDDRGLYLHFHHNHHQQHQHTTKSTNKASDSDSASAARNPDVARAVQVAGFLGLRPVGWVVARPGGVLSGEFGWSIGEGLPWVSVPLTFIFGHNR